MKIKTTKNGLAYLNIGCGSIFSSDWNNIDFIKNKDVLFWDIRKGLPFPDKSMDAVYFSHLLEHLSPTEATNLMSEVNRILKTGGIVRIVVPDLRRVCGEYLRCLENVEKNPSAQNNMRYNWVMLELIDQMVREKAGGLLRETIDSGDFDVEYAQSRIGDLALSGKKHTFDNDPGIISLLKKIKRKLMSIRNKNDPRKTGEVHRWMYDSFSLSRLIKSHGFKDVTSTKFNESMITDWDMYQFDRSTIDPMLPKKPESLFVEGRKI